MHSESNDIVFATPVLTPLAGELTNFAIYTTPSTSNPVRQCSKTLGNTCRVCIVCSGFIRITSALDLVHGA